MLISSTIVLATICSITFLRVTVVVKWSAPLPSTQMILVQIPQATEFFCTVLREDKKKIKKGQVGLFFKKYLTFFLASTNVSTSYCVDFSNFDKILANFSRKAHLFLLYWTPIFCFIEKIDSFVPDVTFLVHAKLSPASWQPLRNSSGRNKQTKMCFKQ